METTNTTVNRFHSGRKLTLARKISGYTQDAIVGEEGFPKVDVRTLRRWEKGGINRLRVGEVASFFKLDLSSFFDERMTESEFIMQVANQFNTAQV